MTLSLVLTCMLTGLPIPEMPRTPADRFNHWLAEMKRSELRRAWIADIEELHRQHLELTRKGQAFLKEQLDLMEKFIDRNPEIFQPKDARQEKQEIAKLRVDWEFGQKYLEVLEWYAEQRKVKPGWATEQAADERLQEVMDEWGAWKRGVFLAPGRGS